MGKAGSKGKGSAPKISVDGLVRAAVIRALTQGGDLKLADKVDGLFASAAGDNKAAIERCLVDPAMLVKSPSDASKGKLPKIVRATPNAIDLVWSLCNEEEQQKLLPIREGVRKKQYDVIRARVLASRDALARWQAELVEVHLDFNRHIGFILEEHKNAVRTLKGLEEQLASLPVLAAPEAQEPHGAETKAPALPLSSNAPAPRTVEDESYRRQLAQALVSAWREAPDANSKTYMAQAIHNSGIERIGTVGEHVSFVSQFHLPGGPMFPGDSVKIVEPGWKMRDDRGEYILAPARVELLE